MIEILGLTDCVPCKQSKELLSQTNIDFAYYNVKNRGNKRTTELKKQLFGMTPTPSFPIVFVDGEFKGAGLDVVKELTCK